MLCQENDTASSSERIIVAEDDCGFRGLLSTVVAESTGMEVQPAVDGIDALQRLQDGPGARVLLLDVDMPRMDGLGVLRALEQREGLSIIVMSAVDHRQQAFELGCDDYLAKPFDLQDLDEKLGYWLKHPRVA